MAGVNKVIIIGNLGQDPEVRYTASGNPVANFSVATSEQWNDKNGQRQERTEWHRIVAWGKLAELCGEYLSKGRQCYVEGKLQTRNWEDRDGHKRYTTEIVANQVTFLGGGGGSSGGGSTGGGGSGGGRSDSGTDRGSASGGSGSGSGGGAFDYGPPPMTDDDVPF